MKIQITSEYPVRYAALLVNGILFEAKEKKQSSGYEWAAYDDRYNGIYGQIVSSQKGGLIVQITRDEKAIEVIYPPNSIGYWNYTEFEKAKSALANKLDQYISSIK
jgi:hypothetical protein